MRLVLCYLFLLMRLVLCYLFLGLLGLEMNFKVHCRYKFPYVVLKIVGEICQGEFLMHVLEGNIQSPHSSPKRSTLTFTSNKVLIKCKDH